MRARWLLMRSIKSRRKRYEACDDAVGLDLPCAAGRLGLQSAPSALPRALGFNSHLAIKYTPHRKVRGIFYGGDGGS